MARQLPAYLTNAQAAALASALDDFHHHGSKPFYLNKYDSEVLQGDGWTRLRMLSEQGGLHVDVVSGLVLSNSCDIEPANLDSLPKLLTFVPILSLAEYRSVLLDAGVTADAIATKFDAIRRQHVYGLFFVPAGAALDEDSFAWLGSAQSMTLQTFLDDQQRKKLFTLNQLGHYLLLFKLSVHFCRFTEGVNRAV